MTDFDNDDRSLHGSDEIGSDAEFNKKSTASGMLNSAVASSFKLTSCHGTKLD